jgi:hypothetical protein
MCIYTRFALGYLTVNFILVVPTLQVRRKNWPAPSVPEEERL